ncbi:MAG: DNA polymerase III subunit gamma/tau [Phycisphaerae bacterium]
MSYRVLARSYRSETFDDVVGQEPISTTLQNAITSGRVHHGYLFSGTRGVGKTSMARILAKALNCFSSKEPTPEPCCKCESCTAIAAGEDIDVVEIDAASNNGVDDIRDLRGNAGFHPVRSRFKIYIIDEVHMLSKQAFNALLKTLEEPPEHVKFIMATTEPEKVLATIKSRCQQFDFRAIAVDRIASHLQSVLDQEKTEADPAVVRRIARLARGSMRDGLSLLDKLISYDAQKLTLEVAEAVIPASHDEMASAVIARIIAADPGGALTELDRALQSGRAVERFCESLIEHARTLMVLNVCGGETDLVDIPAHMRDTLAEQTHAMDAPALVYMVTLLEALRRDAKRSGASRALAESAVVRLALAQNFTAVSELIQRLDSGDLPPCAATDAQQSDPAKKKESARADRETPLADKTGSDTQPAPRPVADEAASTHTAPPQETVRHESPRQQERSPVSSQQWQQVARDPAVQRVCEAVEGTLFDVQPATKGVTAQDEGPTK